MRLLGLPVPPFWPRFAAPVAVPRASDGAVAGRQGPGSLSHPSSTVQEMEVSPTVGRVIGTEDATPLEFWVGVQEGAYLQLDDAVALERVLPGGEIVKVYGVVSQVRARHIGVR